MFEVTLTYRNGWFESRAYQLIQVFQSGGNIVDSQ